MKEDEEEDGDDEGKELKWRQGRRGKGRIRKKRTCS